MEGIKIIFGFAVLIVFLVLEWTLASSGATALSWVPFASLAAVWWMGRLAFAPRMAYGALAGFFLDAALMRPFGVSVALFMTMAGIMEVLHAILSRHDSRAARGANTLLILLLFFILLPVIESMARHL